jgi:hypothetical protein
MRVKISVPCYGCRWCVVVEKEPNDNGVVYLDPVRCSRCQEELRKKREQWEKERKGNKS